MLTPLLALHVLLAQTPEASDPGLRAAQAAEKAAQAAEKAAQAAQASAESVAKLASTLTPPPAPAPQKPEEKPAAAPAWTGNAGLGLIWLTGNSNSLSGTASVGVQRPFDSWIVGLKATGGYGQTTLDSTEPQVVALNALGQLRLDRRFSELVGAYATVGLDTDHVKSVEVRGTAEAGAGLVWLDHKEGKWVKSYLRTDLAFRYTNEARFQYYEKGLPAQMDLPDVTMISPRLGLAYKYGLTENVSFSEDAEVLPNIVGEGRVLVNSSTRISARLTDSTSLGITFDVKHDSNPAQGKKSTDTALTVGLDMAI